MEYPQNYELCPNVHILGNKVISYQTHVGTIEGDKLLVFGKFSRSTHKHVHYVARTLELSIQMQSTEPQDFYKHHQGVSPHKIDGSISPAMSKHLLRCKLQGKPIEEAIMDAAEHLPRKDWDLLVEHLGMPEGTKKPLKTKIEWNPLPGGPRARVKENNEEYA